MPVREFECCDSKRPDICSEVIPMNLHRKSAPVLFHSHCVSLECTQQVKSSALTGMRKRTSPEHGLCLVAISRKDIPNSQYQSFIFGIPTPAQEKH